MSITVKTRKILWARSGNQCAFPGCRQELVEKVQGIGSDIVVGVEAHIVPRKRNGPSDRLGGLLFRLWRAGLSDPDRVCEEFRGFKAAKWHDGGMAEWVMSMTMELDLSQRAKANN